MGQTPSKAQRKEFRNIGITDIRNYRLPLAGIVSILHRISGLALFLSLPLVMCLLVAMFTSADKFAAATQFLSQTWVKVLALGLVWAIMHHAVAGVRYLVMDVHVKVSKEGGKQTAIMVLIVSLILTALVGVKLFA